MKKSCTTKTIYDPQNHQFANGMANANKTSSRLMFY